MAIKFWGHGRNRNQSDGIGHPMNFMRKIVDVTALVLVTMLCASCSSSTPSSEKTQSPAAPAAPQIPPDIQAAAESDLGSGVEVLVFGDLAKTGRTQALLVNRLNVTPQGMVPGILAS